MKKLELNEITLDTLIKLIQIVKDSDIKLLEGLEVWKHSEGELYHFVIESDDKELISRILDVL